MPPACPCWQRHLPSRITPRHKTRAGIGKEIARQLLQNSYKVILGCRSEDAGRAAAAELGGAVTVLALDISDAASIGCAAAAVAHEFGALDVLVNNAGIAFKGSDPTPFTAQAAPTVDTNFFGTVACTAAFLPLLLQSKNSPRIVNVASQAGHLDILPSRERRQAFESDALTLAQLEGFMREFVADVQNGQHAKVRRRNCAAMPCVFFHFFLFRMAMIADM